jgi:hypothetical protein
MKTQIKILIAEHDPHDLELILYELTASGLNFTPMVVQNEGILRMRSIFLFQILFCQIILSPRLAGLMLWK